MRSRLLVIAFAATCTGDVAAAPREPGPSPAAVAAGRAFARNLGTLADTISRHYVRPVSTTDLYVTAMDGLFDAAAQKPPEHLIRKLKAAKDEQERIDLIAVAWAGLAKHPRIDGKRELRAAISSFATVLDPHCVLAPYGATNGTQVMETFGFDFEGEAEAVTGAASARGSPVAEDLEALLTVPPLPLRVLSVRAGTSAQRAGLRPGDIVRSINGIAATGPTAEAAYETLFSLYKGVRKHRLTVERVGHDRPLQLTMAEETFVPESIFGVVRKADNTWDHWIDTTARIAYVRLGPIERRSGDELGRALEDLPGLRGLIFDLRWCPGGYVDGATEVASTFLERGVIARMAYRDQGGKAKRIDANRGLVRVRGGSYPILVLINGQTTGGGELIAAALKDNGRATLAGTRTFGKATIQTGLNNVPGLPGYTYKLTTGVYSRPNGKNLQRLPTSKASDDWGLRPDPGYLLPTSSGLAQRLQEWHQLYVLRPGGNREVTDLDDPDADSQRREAVARIREMAAAAEGAKN